MAVDGRGEPGDRLVGQAPLGRLAPGWTAETATGLLYGLIATDLISRLLHQRGWSQQQLAQRLALLLRSTLVADERHARPAR